MNELKPANCIIACIWGKKECFNEIHEEVLVCHYDENHKFVCDCSAPYEGLCPMGDLWNNTPEAD